VIEPGEAIGPEAKENKSGVAVATSRGRYAGIVATAEPDEASVQVTAAVTSRACRSSPTRAPAPTCDGHAPAGLLGLAAIPFAGLAQRLPGLSARVRQAGQSTRPSARGTHVVHSR
jgi:hypothetical protein